MFAFAPLSLSNHHKSNTEFLPLQSQPKSLGHFPPLAQSQHASALPIMRWRLLVVGDFCLSVRSWIWPSDAPADIPFERSRLFNEAEGTGRIRAEPAGLGDLILAVGGDVQTH